MTKTVMTVMTGILLDEHRELSLSELCRASGVHAEYIIDLVNQGILKAQPQQLSQWRFSARCLKRTRIALRLQRDLHINLAGAALALELLDEIERLRRQIRR